MRSAFFILLCLTGALTSATGQSRKDQEVLDTEALRFGLMTRKDTAALRLLLADDLVYTHSNGLVESKQAHLDAVGSGGITYFSMEREAGAHLRRYGKWAFTNGVVHMTGALKGVNVDLRLRYSAAYRKQKGTWRLVNWQTTRI